MKQVFQFFEIHVAAGTGITISSTVKVAVNSLFHPYRIYLPWLELSAPQNPEVSTNM
jgi:hypothetical protein